MNTMNNQLEASLFEKATMERIPLKMTLEITPLCNMNCKMCYVRESYKDAATQIKSLDYWLAMIRQMKEAGTLFVSLIGGEPMIHPHIREIYEELIYNGMQVNLTTNGTLFAEGVPDWMLNQKPRYITVSIYGSSNETYQKLTGHPHGYDLVLQGIENIKKAEIPIQINLCVTKDNIHDLPSILQFATENDLKIQYGMYEYPNETRRNYINAGNVNTRKGEKAAQDRFSPSEVAEHYWQIEKILHPENYANKIRLYAEAPYGNDSPINTDCFTCRAGSSTGWINWQGKLCCCGLIEHPAIEINHTDITFSDAWNKLTNIIQSTKTCSECANCEKRELCITCPAKMYAETASFLRKPEYVCQITDELIKYAKNLSKDFTL